MSGTRVTVSQGIEGWRALCHTCRCSRAFSWRSDAMAAMYGHVCATPTEEDTDAERR